MSLRRRCEAIRGRFTNRPYERREPTRFASRLLTNHLLSRGRPFARTPTRLIFRTRLNTIRKTRPPAPEGLRADSLHDT